MYQILNQEKGYSGVASKLYLTKEQVATMYELFRDKIADSTIASQRIRKKYYSTGYPATVELLYSYIGEALLSFAPAWVKSLADYAGRISDILSATFNDVLDVFLEDPSEYANICIQLEDVGGAKKQYGKYSAQNGMLITKR